MTDAQLKALIAYAFKLEGFAGESVKKARPYLFRSMRSIRIMLEGLPDESLIREAQWRRLKRDILTALEPYGKALESSLAQELSSAKPVMEEEAIRDLTRVVKTDPSFTPRTSSSLQALGGLDAKVNGARLSQLFREAGDPPTSRVVQSFYKEIDRAVQQGILQGKPTADIADEIISATGGRLGGRGRQINQRATAIARTAVQDQNRQVHEAVWQANQDALEGMEYEYTAMMDSRTCQICAPIDGAIRPTPALLPQTPVHVNCRCQVILIDPDDEDDLARGAIQISHNEFKYKGKTLDQMSKDERKEALGQGRLYATPVKVNGEKFNRKAVQIQPVAGRRPRYADFLYSMRDSPATQREYFEGGAIGERRANAFNALVKRGLSPEAALGKLIVNDPSNARDIRARLKKVEPQNVRFVGAKELNNLSN